MRAAPGARPRHGRRHRTRAPTAATLRRSADFIESTYQYHTTEVSKEGGKTVRRPARRAPPPPPRRALPPPHRPPAAPPSPQVARPKTVEYQFRTSRKVPKLGLMLCGWGGNNGSTTTAGIIANTMGMSWETKNGTKKANVRRGRTQTRCLRSPPLEAIAAAAAGFPRPGGGPIRGLAARPASRRHYSAWGAAPRWHCGSGGPGP